jgi:cardiolipin synthase
LIAAGVLSALHALLWKRDPRAALGWIMACLILPGLGPMLYWLLGVNRLRTRGQKMRRVWPELAEGLGAIGAPEDRAGVQDVPRELVQLARVGDAVTKQPLMRGNEISLLHNGEQAYPAMIQAIREARSTVHLCSYIFAPDDVGRQFIAALADATERGLSVRVLIDGIGEKYSWPRASGVLEAAGVRVARFLPPHLFRPNLHFNLRNHRKLLLLDGTRGFTGGMNIGERYLAADTGNPRRTIDLHFAVQGPVIAQMEETFAEDWAFATDEPPATCELAAPSPRDEGDDGALCRGITDGPNEDLDKLAWILMGAISAANRRLLIMTPYFVPDRTIIRALIGASLRGVQVQIVLPGKNNLPYVHWASRAMLWELLQQGVRVYYQPAPFVHSKLLVVDDDYAMIGSANIDARSLRLNFEFNVEVYDRAFVTELTRHFEASRDASTETSLALLDARPLHERVRDGLARLAAPYL